MTPDEYLTAVVAEIVRQTGWTQQEAGNMAGDVSDMIAPIEDGLTPSDAASEILLAAAEG